MKTIMKKIITLSMLFAATALFAQEEAPEHDERGSHREHDLLSLGIPQRHVPSVRLVPRVVPRTSS